jgi:hypothetical protein
MTGLELLVLACLVGTEPDDCTVSTAIDFQPVDIMAKTCPAAGVIAQQSKAVDPRSGKGVYFKIACDPRRTWSHGGDMVTVFDEGHANTNPQGGE